jgi:hypothetical protein
MTAERLLRLYPRKWRDRYGEEFLELAGTGALRLQQIVDIVSGAIDAWLSSDVRRATRANTPTRAVSGGPMTSRLSGLCIDKNLRYTTRDALIGSGIMLAGSLTTALVGMLLKRRGFEVAGDVIASNGFLASLVLSMPFWILKGQSWRAQVVVVGGTLLLLGAATFVAYLI